MEKVNYGEIFGEHTMIELTDEERSYFALEPMSQTWESQVFHGITNYYYTRVTVFFDCNTIVKVIEEQKKILDDDLVVFACYSEYDTKLETDNREYVLPLTSRGKAKKLSPTSVTSVLPFGCRFSVIFNKDEDTKILLQNLRANKVFPVGERQMVAKIRNEANFHRFTQHYIATCNADYFSKLYAFMTAKKKTVRYKTGDIFRMELDRTHYCYGIITGEVKKIRSMPALPSRHSLRQLMTVPLMVRFYQLVSERADLTAKDLCDVALGHVSICSDNDIIWGTHTIVDHKVLEPKDIEYHFVCTKIMSFNSHNTLFTQDSFIKDGFLKPESFSLYLEWGFAQTMLPYDQISDNLKVYLQDYSSPYGGVRLCIDPAYAIPDERQKQYPSYKYNLLIPENRAMLEEIFLCLGLPEDTDFDCFAKKFGGLTLQEIAQCVSE